MIYALYPLAALALLLAMPFYAVARALRSIAHAAGRPRVVEVGRRGRR